MLTKQILSNQSIYLDSSSIFTDKNFSFSLKVQMKLELIEIKFCEKHLQTGRLVPVDFQ